MKWWKMAEACEDAALEFQKCLEGTGREHMAIRVTKIACLHLILTRQRAWSLHLHGYEFARTVCQQYGRNGYMY